MKKGEIVEFGGQNFYQISQSAFKTAIYIDNLRRGKELKEYERFVKELIGTFSDLSKQNMRMLAPPENEVLMKLYKYEDCGEERDDEDFFNLQSQSFVRDLKTIKNLPRKKQEGLLEKCGELHGILLREHDNLYGRHRLAA